MKKFIYLEGIVTADAAFDAFGKTLEELFENAALATAEVMADLKTVKTKTTKTIEITAENAEQLLFKFLDQIVFLKDSENILFKKFKVKIADGKQFKCREFHQYALPIGGRECDGIREHVKNHLSCLSHVTGVERGVKRHHDHQQFLTLEAECIGEKINQETQKLRNDVKAVTYHDFKLEQTKQGWRARVILDI